MLTSEEIKDFLPLACLWAEEQERLILQAGVALDDDQQIDAFLVGVKDPTKIRLLSVDKIPVPRHPQLNSAAYQLGLLGGDSIGATYRNGIYIKTSFWNHRNLVVHELAHAMQYERLGGFRPFLEQYLNECFTVGYPLGFLEQEAREIERKICSLT